MKKEVIELLGKELALPCTGIEQDWDIEMANSNKINGFLKYFIDDKKLTVMSLILASYDDL